MKQIDLKNGYAIGRPDPLNFVLLEWKSVKVKQKDKDGNYIKVDNGNGKQVIKTEDEYQWVTLGYYGKLKQLLKGMIDHKCHVSDVSTLSELVEVVDSICNLNAETLEAKLVE